MDVKIDFFPLRFEEKDRNGREHGPGKGFHSFMNFYGPGEWLLFVSFHCGRRWRRGF